MPSISIKTSDAAYSKVKKPFIKQDGDWVAAKKVSVKTEAGWKEVWPGVVYYTWTGTGYNLTIKDLFGEIDTPSTYIFINNGNIGSNTWGVPSLKTGVFPDGSVLIIQNNGVIQGMGGRGGWFNADKSYVQGQAGSMALFLDYPTELQNGAKIWGGGGGGGGSAEWGGSNDNNGPGGGGSGLLGGQGGAVTWVPGYVYPGTAGTQTAGGNTTGYGVGYGGAPGQPGGSGGAIGSSDNRYGPGGAAGAAIVSNGLLTITTQGDIRGPIQ